MLRLIFKISIALLAFLIGVKMVWLWDTSPPAQPRQLEAAKSSAAQAPPIKVSTCDLQDEPDLYEGKLFSVEAVMYSIDGKLLLFGNCARYEHGLPWVDISGFGTLDYLEALLESGGKSSPSVEKKEVDVRIVGMVEKYRGAADDFIPARIIPIEIEQLSPLRKFKPKGAA